MLRVHFYTFCILFCLFLSSKYLFSIQPIPHVNLAIILFSFSTVFFCTSLSLAVIFLYLLLYLKFLFLLFFFVSLSTSLYVLNSLAYYVSYIISSLFYFFYSVSTLLVVVSYFLSLFFFIMSFFLTVSYILTFLLYFSLGIWRQWDWKALIRKF